MLEQMGGVEGIIVSALPVLVIIFGTKRIGLLGSLVIALGVAVVYLVYRMIGKKTLQPAISAFFGVAIGAAFAYFTGEAKGFFIYGIWMSLLYAVVFVLSIVVRWPAVAVIWLGVNGKSMKWRKVKSAYIFYDIATAAWAVVFAARFVVQRYFYNQDNTDALGWAKIIMGFPLTAVVIAMTVVMVRKATARIHAYEKATGEIILGQAPQTGDDAATDPSTTSHATSIAHETADNGHIPVSPHLDDTPRNSTHPTD